jgi:hypothetical protein
LTRKRLSSRSSEIAGSSATAATYCGGSTATRGAALVGLGWRAEPDPTGAASWGLRPVGCERVF